jgi:hypothetical protein
VLVQKIKNSPLEFVTVLKAPFVVLLGDVTIKKSDEIGLFWHIPLRQNKNDKSLNIFFTTFNETQVYLILVVAP